MIKLEDLNILTSVDGRPYLWTGVDEEGQRWLKYDSGGSGVILAIALDDEGYKALHDEETPLRDILTNPKSGKVYMIDESYVETIDETDIERRFDLELSATFK